MTIFLPLEIWLIRPLRCKGGLWGLWWSDWAGIWLVGLLVHWTFKKNMAELLRKQHSLGINQASRGISQLQEFSNYNKFPNRYLKFYLVIVFRFFNFFLSKIYWMYVKNNLGNFHQEILDFHLPVNKFTWKSTWIYLEFTWKFWPEVI